MPIFEYVCRDCQHPFEAIERVAPAVCPKCQSEALDKQLSVFAVSTNSPAHGRATQGPAPCGSCGDPRGVGSCSVN